MSVITCFFRNEVPDVFGRYINELLAHNHFWLEHDHKYIQMLFPMDEGDKFNRHAPLVTDEDRMAFSDHIDLRNRHLQALDMMLEYYGMARNGEMVYVTGELAPQSHEWLKPNNHNQLRISRIIRSLSLLGNHNIAASFCRACVTEAEKHGTVSSKTMDFWYHALRQ
ncbi:hypothetical protein ABT56_07505 [Photobacterium aquae]|uniref:Opioid growth factor receptor (OGFr) conserved domain-containing protein n=1 Tax=Photobacterium aquae TaxID=1195763 RepID=A0A0J1H5I2_9GAMM|nr:opioid growth factor receptor-related protein [Photobacterium aquae]KLV06985.1 hypothetical protein ABT56_07505 [Photobacterium aquae]